MKANFAEFIAQATAQTGRLVIEVERVGDDGAPVPLDDAILNASDTLIVISFDSLRTGQQASGAEIASVRAFLDNPDHLVFVWPHHSIGNADHLSDVERMRLQEQDFFITATGLSRLSNDLAALDARSSPDSACRWRIDLDYGLLMRRMARQRQSRLNQAAIVLVS